MPSRPHRIVVRKGHVSNDMVDSDTNNSNFANKKFGKEDFVSQLLTVNFLQDNKSFTVLSITNRRQRR